MSQITHDATMYTMDVDGDESTVNESQIRKLAKRNGLLDVDMGTIDDVIEHIMDCFPDVTIELVK